LTQKSSETAEVGSSLFVWQSECLAAWFDHGTRGIVSAVTGSGKTMLAIHAAMRLREALHAKGERLNIRVVVPKTFLLTQWKAALLRVAGQSRHEIGIYCGGHKDDPALPSMLYVLNSARFTLARHILADIKSGCHVLLIVDECHHLSGSYNAKILEFYPRLGGEASRYHALGLSASAESVAGNERVFTALGRVIYHYGMSRALRDGVVSDCVLLPCAVSFTRDERNAYDDMTIRLRKALAAVKKLCPGLRYVSGAAFFAMLESLSGERGKTGTAAGKALLLSHQRREAVHFAENRIRCACDLVSHLPDDSRIILFGERIEVAARLASQIGEKLPGQVAIYHSAMGKEAAKNAIDCYQSGEARILVTCRALDEGFDVPDTDVGIVVSSTRVERQMVQRLGRILRCGNSPLPVKLYYIYLEDTGDEGVVFGQDFPFPLVPLSYHGRGGFDSADWRELSSRAFLSGKDKITPTEQTELLRNMKLCLPRGDFILPEDLCRKMRERAASTAQRNYWTAALAMARERRD
jgi:superfamily II DNA or RNA helicase